MAKRSSVAKKTPRKKRTSSSGKPTGATPGRQVSHLDKEIVKLINQRAALAAEASRAADAVGDADAADPDDDAASRAVQVSTGPLSDDCVRAIFREIVSGSRELQKKTCVAFLGPSYSYSHLAAIHQLGQSVEFLPVSTISSVFDEVVNKRAEYGIVPIENSTDGRVADTLDNFRRHEVSICAEVQLIIHHNLLGKCARADVKKVYSRPQALSQCRHWLSTHLPHAESIEVASTSSAAERAATETGAAAIASNQAGIHYGLKTLARNIEDSEYNLTRFAVIADHTADRSGSDLTAMMLQLSRDRSSGALADATAVFKRNRVNLVWIESFPTGDAKGGYLFFLEFEGHYQDTKVRRAIESLRKKAVLLKILGSYAQNAPFE